MHDIAPITAVVPAHNRAGTVETALDSIQDQKLRPANIIVVDDGSTDKTLEVLHAYARKHSNVTVLHQENAGPSAARNAGIHTAKTEWVAFLDSDDYWYPHHLEGLYRIVLANRDLVWVAGAHELLHLDGSVEKRRVRMPHEVSIIESYLSATHQGVPVHTNAVMVRLDALLGAGCFREDWRVFEDSFLWFCLGVKHPRLGYSHRVSSRYIQGDTSLTSEVRRDLDRKTFLGKRFLQTAINYAQTHDAIDRRDVQAYLNQVVNTQLKAMLTLRPASFRPLLTELIALYPQTRLYGKTHCYHILSKLLPPQATRAITQSIRSALSR